MTFWRITNLGTGGPGFDPVTTTCIAPLSLSCTNHFSAREWLEISTFQAFQQIPTRSQALRGQIV